MAMIDILDFLGRLGQEALKQEAREEPQETEILDAEKLDALTWMSANQLAVIYGYGKKRKVKLADDPETYASLNWLSQSQLEAIFGREEDNK